MCITVADVAGGVWYLGYDVVVVGYMALAIAAGEDPIGPHSLLERSPHLLHRPISSRWQSSL